MKLNRNARFCKVNILPVCLLLIALLNWGIPRIEAQIPQDKLENPGAGSTMGSFGHSIAVDRATLIVGAPTTDPCNLKNAGAAHIYTSDGKGGWIWQAELIASDPAAEDKFGSAVAISGDTVVIGAPYDDANSGSAYVFTRSGNVWTQKAKLTSPDAANDGSFGYSVSILGDTIIIGKFRDDEAGVDSGAAYVFTRSGENWTQQAKLMALDAESGDSFGFSVAITTETALVGALGSGDCGSAYVFTRTGTIWSQEAKLNALDKTRSFGMTLSISGDTAVISAYYDDYWYSNWGAAYIFARQNGAWSQQAKLKAPDNRTRYGGFGYSVGISGEKVIVGSYESDGSNGNDYGEAFTFTRWNGVWDRGYRIYCPETVTGEAFGCAVSISGETKAVGACFDDGRDILGCAYVFTYGNRVKLANSFDSATNDMFGNSVSISDDTAVVGMPNDSVHGLYSGSVLVFMRSGDHWTQQARLVSNDIKQGDQFGSAVAISDGIIVVGAPGDNDDYGNELGLGFVFVFTKNGSTWSQQAKLKPSNRIAYSRFGSFVSISGSTIAVGMTSTLFDAVSACVFDRSDLMWVEQARLTSSDRNSPVSISGDTLVFGAPARKINEIQTGAALVYSRTGSNWIKQATLTASDGAAGDLFGSSVSISGDTIVIGASNNDNGTTNTGAAYVYSRSEGNWNQQAKLTASNAETNALFGCNVSIRGNVAVIGASGANGATGAAYIYVYSGGKWIKQIQLASNDASAGDRFGASVFVNPGRIIIGAPSDDAPETDAGSAYIFDFMNIFPTRANSGYMLYK